ncbi:M1 family metallopeptidase [Candidatus Daviesbacteria bacterium]|nr:M1 family metallopeptidase [Candidatus Daviesbacteria bacterium]
MKSVRLPSHVMPERYKILLKPDLNEFTFTGEETISLVLEKPTKQITLHAAELEIESAEFIHQNQETRVGKTSYDKKAETAILTFPKKLAAGKGQLKLTFRGILNDKMRGFYRSKYEVGGKVKHLATTQFESTDARRAFPCFDEPNRKAIFEVSLIIPKGTKAISNTIETAVKEHEGDYQIIEFAPTPKMSTYLLAFIVGDFEYIEEKRKNGKVRVFTTPGKKAQAKFALDVAVKCLNFYEDYFGIELPFPVLDMIAIPDFAAGAMENWGAVTYRESTLLIDEERSSTGNKQWVALVIAHELAHMWFGDLVTMKWWTHLWLNEGFASFIEYLAIDHIFPQWDIWTQFVGTELEEALELDALKNTHPVEVEVGHPAEIAEIFDKVSYSKGASVLRMLMSYLGEKDFRKGLQHYLKKYAYSNAQTLDLWNSLEQVSGKPVVKVMKSWTSKPGHPVVRLQRAHTESGEGNRLQLTQSRFFSSSISKKESKDKTVWSIPVSVILGSGATPESSSKDSGQVCSPQSGPRMTKILMDKKSISIDVPKDGWIKLNAGETSVVRVSYPEEYLKGLEQAVKDGKLSAPDRLGLIRDIFDLAEAGETQTHLALELTSKFTQEEDYVVWSEITANLAKLESLIAYEPFYQDFRNYGQKIYNNIVKKVGWVKRPGEKHTDSLLRSMVLYRFGSFGDKETIQKAQKLFGSKGLDPDLRGVVYNLITENGGLKEFNTLVRMYKGEDNQQERDRIGRSLGVFKDRDLLEKALDFAISEHVRFQNSLQIIASVWGNSHGRYLAWEFIKKHWQLLKDRYAGGHYFTRVFSPAGEFTKVSDALDLERFIKKNPAPEAKRTIAQVLEQVYSNAQWLARDRKNMLHFFKTYA